MVLPPGRSEHSVPGISPTLEPELYQAAAELNAWVNYLLQPHTNDGPRIYRQKGRPGPDPMDLEMPGRVYSLDEQDHLYDTVSVLERYAGDPDVFFRPAQAVSGILESAMHDTYVKLATGCLTWQAESDTRPDDGSSDELPDDHKPVTDVQDPEFRQELFYPELHPARLNWMQMRNGSGWIAPEANAAHDYEGDFIPFQVYTENGMYKAAEHLVRYQAIFKKAGQDMAKLMTALTESFAHPPDGSGGGGFDFDVPSIIVTAIVALTTTVLTGGPGGATMTVALATAIEAIGEAVKTAEPKKNLTLDTHDRLGDTAQQYLDGVNKIERETAEAIEDLRDNLRIKLAALRDIRGKVSAEVPHIRNYRPQ